MIVYETAAGYVARTDKGYTVFLATLTHAVAAGYYGSGDYYLERAKARLNTITAEREAGKP